MRRHTTKQDHELDHEPEHGGGRNSRGSGSDLEQEVESAPWLPRTPRGKPCWTKTLSWFSASLGPHFPTPGRVRAWADVNPTEVAVFRDQGVWTHHIPLETHSCSDGCIKALRQVESEPGGRSLGTSAHKITWCTTLHVHSGFFRSSSVHGHAVGSLRGPLRTFSSVGASFTSHGVLRRGP